MESRGDEREILLGKCTIGVYSRQVKSGELLEFGGQEPGNSQQSVYRLTAVAPSTIGRIWLARTFSIFSISPLGHRISKLSTFVAEPSPKMEAKIALGNIAAATSDFLHLLMAAGAKNDSGADGVAIRFGARQLQ